MTRFFYHLLHLTLLCFLATSQPLSLAQTSAPSTQEIKFKDFFRWPVGPLGLEFTDTIKRTDNQRVSILGYMVAQEKNPVGQFLFTSLPLRTSEEADGDADDLPANTLAVLLPALPGQGKAQPITHRPGLIKLTGTLKIGRHELEDGRIVWVRLLLDNTAP